jgi:hypothetical protein
MSNLGVNIQALTSASAQIQEASAEFGRGWAQVAGTSRARGATAEATVLLERVLTALGEALRKAEGELQQVGGHLSDTASTYTNTERMLASWVVPGAGAGSGGIS